MRNPRNGYWVHWRRHVVETRYRILRDELKIPPVGPVGEFSYSNLGYMIAGAMAEKVTGKSWETLMEERLFTPLGMAAAGFRFQEGPDYNEEQPSGHALDAGGSWGPLVACEPTGMGTGGNRLCFHRGLGQVHRPMVPRRRSPRSLIAASWMG